MEKQRKYKVFSIIALLFAIVGLSVGFAAFQKMLNLSSSANVRVPTSDDIVVEVYGLMDAEEVDKLALMQNIDFTKWLTDKSYAWSPSPSTIHYDDYASIVKSENKLSLNIDVKDLIGKNYIGHYYFVIKNNSQFPIYLYLSDSSINSMVDNFWFPKACSVQNGQLSIDTINNICENTILKFQVGDKVALDKTASFLDGNYQVDVNEYIFIVLGIIYEGTQKSDEEMVIDFNSVDIGFGVLPYQYTN